jgi:long-subunit acyl-CoA synthetase (AMP-forming)
MPTSSETPVRQADSDATAPGTLCAAFQATAASEGDAVALRTADGSVEISWSQYAARVRSLAAGLAAHGIGRGDTVAIMLANRPEGHLIDTAALHLGATPFSIYNTSAPSQIEYLLTHSAATLIVTERQYVERVLEVRASLPALRYVFVVEEAVAGTADLEEMIAAADPGFDFEQAWKSVTPDDVATLIYTSGTTGAPKGVELSHDNILWTCKSWLSVMNLEPGGRFMSYLPMAHLADRVFAHYLQMVVGGSVTTVADAKAAVPTVGKIRPTLWLGVPRVWEKLKASLEAGFASESDEAKRAAIAQGLQECIEKVRLEQAGEPVPADLAERCEAADAAIMAPTRAKLGFDQNPFLLSGSAPIPLDVLEFFAALGIPINEGYGMTESSAVVTLNRAESRRYGTVGSALPGVEVKLAEDGELLCRGRLVMHGYRNDPERTAEAVDSEGWLHTGDICTIDDGGFVRIVDRKKELIISSAGKNMSPANIEAAMKSGSPLIGIAVAIGDSRPFNTALIVLEPEATAVFAKEHSIAEADIATDERVLAEVAAGIERANSTLSRVEQIKKHVVLDGDWVPGGEELTPTLKLKRKPINEKYAETIESMYS